MAQLRVLPTVHLPNIERLAEFLEGYSDSYLAELWPAECKLPPSANDNPAIGPCFHRTRLLRLDHLEYEVCERIGRWRRAVLAAYQKKIGGRQQRQTVFTIDDEHPWLQVIVGQYTDDEATQHGSAYILLTMRRKYQIPVD